MPTNSPKGTQDRFQTAINAWRSVKPAKKFLGLTVDEFETELKPCFDVRAEIADLDAKRQAAIVRRNDADAQATQLVDRLVNAIKSDANEGPDSELLEALGYVIKSKRKSGLHRLARLPQVQALPKAA